MHNKSALSNGKVNFNQENKIFEIRAKSNYIRDTVRQYSDSFLNKGIYFKISRFNLESKFILILEKGIRPINPILRVDC